MRENIQDFLKFLEVDKKYAENTIAAYRNDLQQFFERVAKDDEGIDSWDDIEREAINDYIEQLKGGEYTSSTVARKVAAIKDLGCG